MFFHGLGNKTNISKIPPKNKNLLNETKILRTYRKWYDHATIISFAFLLSFFFFIIKKILEKSVQRSFLNCVCQEHPGSYDFFRSLGCVNENISQGRSYSQMSLNINDCFFNRFAEFFGSGGVIYVSSGSYSMMATSLMFYNCSSSNNGGAIIFISETVSMKMVCAFKCNTVNENHFALLRTQLENQVEYFSISQCSPQELGQYSISLLYGMQRVDNVNSSLNNCDLASGIYISSPSSFSSIYCTFSNNKCFRGICIYFNTNNGGMSYANVFHNVGPLFGIVYIYRGSPFLTNMIFNQNTITLFYIHTGSLNVSDSIIYHVGSFSSATTVITSNNNTINTSETFQIVQSYQIHFFNSYYCHADHPLPLKTPELTPTIDLTSQPTINETPLISNEAPTYTSLDTLSHHNEDEEDNNHRIEWIIGGCIIVIVLVLVLICSCFHKNKADSEDSISDSSKIEKQKTEWNINLSDNSHPDNLVIARSIDFGPSPYIF